MIFLSASIPQEGSDASYYETADITAIRDSIRALSTVIVPHTRLIWGGHPAITPLVRHVMQRLDISVRSHMTIYQSAFFKHEFILENDDFEDVRVVPRNVDRESSLADMRLRMTSDNEFLAGIFVGGMKGVLDEFDLFTRVHPNALVLPVASTGAAAKIIFEQRIANPDQRLMREYAYMSLFRSLLKDIL